MKILQIKPLPLRKPTAHVPTWIHCWNNNQKRVDTINSVKCNITRVRMLKVFSDNHKPTMRQECCVIVAKINEPAQMISQSTLEVNIAGLYRLSRNVITRIGYFVNVYRSLRVYSLTACANLTPSTTLTLKSPENRHKISKHQQFRLIAKSGMWQFSKYNIESKRNSSTKFPSAFILGNLNWHIGWDGFLIIRTDILSS